MNKAECVPKLMNRLLHEAFRLQHLILRQAVIFIVQAVQGHNRADAVELRLPENKSQNGYKEIYLGNTENFYRIGRRMVNQLKKDARRIVLTADAVVGFREIYPPVRNKPRFDTE